MRDFQQGDIVLFKQETAATASYRLGLVGEVYPSLSDGKVSRVLVKYKNPGEKGYRVSERHACKLVLVIPVDEQSIIEDANNSEQVPSAQNDSEQVPFAQDQMGGREDVSGQQVRDQPGGKKEEELTRHLVTPTMLCRLAVSLCGSVMISSEVLSLSTEQFINKYIPYTRWGIE